MTESDEKKGRKRSAFNIFCKENNIEGDSVCKQSRIWGEKWKKLSSSEKESYEAKAATMQPPLDPPTANQTGHLIRKLKQTCDSLAKLGCKVGGYVLDEQGHTTIIAAPHVIGVHFRKKQFLLDFQKFCACSDESEVEISDKEESRRQVQEFFNKSYEKTFGKGKKPSYQKNAKNFYTGLPSGVVLKSAGSYGKETKKAILSSNLKFHRSYEEARSYSESNHQAMSTAVTPTPALCEPNIATAVPRTEESMSSSALPYRESNIVQAMVTAGPSTEESTTSSALRESNIVQAMVTAGPSTEESTTSSALRESNIVQAMVTAGPSTEESTTSSALLNDIVQGRASLVEACTPDIKLLMYKVLPDVSEDLSQSEQYQSESPQTDQIPNTVSEDLSQSEQYQSQSPKTDEAPNTVCQKRRIPSKTEKDVYAVKKLMKKRLRRNKKEYLVHWDGYSQSSASWVPAKDISTDLKKAFHKRT